MDFWIFDADTDITFWPFWRALIFLVQTSTALFTPFWKFGVHTRRTFHPRSTLLMNFGILYADTDNTFYLFFAVWCRYRHHFLTVFDSSMNPSVALSYPFDWFSVFWCRYRHHFLPTSVTHVHLTTVLVHTIVYNRVRTRCTIRCSYSTSTVR